MPNDSPQTGAKPRQRLTEALQPWMALMRDYPGFLEWKSKSISRTLYYDDPLENNSDGLTAEFVFSPELERQHIAIMAFYNLYTTQFAIEDCQSYFRRYPFYGLTVSKEQHLRYCCEMYFSRIYEFSERLKKLLNSIKPLSNPEPDVGRTIKLFAREFAMEMKERNLIHHHTCFDDIVLDKLHILRMMSSVDNKEGTAAVFRAEHQRTYRRASKEWSERVRRRSKQTGEFLDAVADFMLMNCDFIDAAKRPTGTSARDATTL